VEARGALGGGGLAVEAGVVGVALPGNAAGVHPVLTGTVGIAWFRPLQSRSSFTFVRNIVFEITGVLALLLVRVEHEAVRTQRPPALTIEAGPVLVTLVGVREQETVLR